MSTATNTTAPDAVADLLHRLGLETSNPEQAAALRDLSSAIDKALAQGPGQLKISTSKQRERLTPPPNTFCQCFHLSLAAIIKKTKMSRTAIVLILELIGLMGNGNLVSVNQKALTVRLGIGKNSVNKAWNELLDGGVMLKMDDGTIYLNPQYITKEAFHTVAKKYPAQMMAGLAALMEHGIPPTNWAPAGAA